jgi:DNA-binding response OmpR family regulator
MFESKILVVEDDPHLLDLYRMELEDEGYRVFTAVDGSEAIQKAQTESLNLVVLDIKLDKVGGLEVLKEIKKVKKELPVILNSAYEIYKMDFSTWLADAYIMKSSNLDELKGKIKELLKID